LLVSQTLTLYVTPVVYIYLDRIQQRLYGRRSTVGEFMAPAKPYTPLRQS